MRTKKKDEDKNYVSLPGFEGGYKQAVSEVYEEYKKVDQALQDIIKTNPARPAEENEFELCQEIAIALKQELRESGLTREAFCDEVNKFLGRTEERYKADPPECRKLLTKTILDKMISKPVNYPIDGYYFFAFQHILGFGVINAIVAARGGRVMSEEDRRLITLAQVRELKEKAHRLEKQLA